MFYLLTYLFLKLKKSNINIVNLCKNENYLPKVTIVVPTYNEEDIIERKLRNLLGQDYPLNKMEILVVDSSTDRTPIIVERISRKYSNIKLLKENKRKGLASALNFGYSQASGEIVIKSDSDILHDRSSIRQIVSNFCNPKVGAVSGKQILITSTSTEEGYRRLIDLKRIVENYIDSIYLMEPFSAFRKNLIEPIDPQSVADDAELGIKIRKKGYKVIFDPKAVFYESIPEKLIKRIKIKSRRAQGHIKLMLSNINILFNKKYGKYGKIIYPLNFFMIIVSPWLTLIILILIISLFYTYLKFIGIITTTFMFFILMIALVIEKPKILSGFAEAQISLLIGFIKLLIGGPEYIWEKVR